MLKKEIFKRLMLLFTVVTILAVVPVLGGDHYDDDDDRCGDRVVGTYTRTIRRTDVLRDGSNIDHTYVTLLTLNDDGTVNQYFTGRPDFMMSLGTATPSAGSWKCRKDGKLIVTIIRAVYEPVIVTDPATGDTFRDLMLLRHERVTRLFTIVNNNTLNYGPRAFRFYSPTEDPADPHGGTLGSTAIGNAEFKRVKASDGDLTP